MNLIYLLTYIIIIFFGFYLSLIYNNKIKNYDNPGKNKIHKIKAVTSGGLFPYIFFSFILFFFFNVSEAYHSSYVNNIPRTWFASFAILVLTLVSFIDDKSYLPYQLRLILQIVIIFISISLFPIDSTEQFQSIFSISFIPIKVDTIMVITLWIFIINSTNFLDGYDGIHSGHGILTLIPLSIIFYILDEYIFFLISLMSLVIFVIFIPFNMSSKNKLFIGDAGSIPGGYIIGWLSITLIDMGYLISSILVNILFFGDIFVSLIARLLKKKSIFERHNDFLFKKIIKKKGFWFYLISMSIIQFFLVIIAIYLII